MNDNQFEKHSSTYSYFLQKTPFAPLPSYPVFPLDPEFFLFYTPSNQKQCLIKHSTFGDAADLAIEAGVKPLGLFCHGPDRADDDLGQQVEFCQERIRLAGGAPGCFSATEGMEIER